MRWRGERGLLNPKRCVRTFSVERRGEEGERGAVKLAVRRRLGARGGREESDRGLIRVIEEGGV